MQITQEDRYTVLERKLMEAESALFGCRAVLNHIRRDEQMGDGGDEDLKGASGLYPGQLQPNGLPDEETEDEECIE